MSRRDLWRALVASGSRVDLDGPAPTITPPDRETARRAVELLTEHREPWRPQGSGRRPDASAAAGLSTRGLRGVLDLWPQDLVCRVGAGTPLGWLDDALAEHRLRLAAHAPVRATVGGALASADRGLRSAVNGGLRDRVLGATFVDGAGNLVKAGARVVKNVAGYDLARLHHGARGAFGLLLDLVVRLDARPQTERAARWACPLQALAERLTSVRRPAAAVDPHVQVWANAFAADVLGFGAQPILIAAVEGWAETIDRWSADADAATPVDLGPVQDLFLREGTRWAVRWSTPPSAWLQRWPALEAELVEVGAEPWALGDCLAGEMLLSIRPELRAVDVLRRRATPVGPVMLDWAAAPPVAPVEHSSIGLRLKAAFDPHGLLGDLPAPWRGLP